MKLLQKKLLKDGRTRITVEMDANESTHHLITVAPNSFWRLGYPLDDQIIESHHLTGIQRTAWDAYSQKWVDV